MTDFLHSVVGEVSDKVVQSEVQDLDAKLAAAEQQSQSGGTTSTLKKILDNIPFALLGLGDSDFGNQADKLQQDATAKKLEQTSISDGGDGRKVAGMDVGQLKTQAAQTMKDIYPVLEFHDKVMKAMQKGIDKIPGASDLLENLTGAMQIFVFSILAPYVKPILMRVKTELAAGSGGVLTASENAQFNVFDDGNSSNPTHSVLSKDHFTNLLNPIAGRVASEVVKFATPLIVSAWEDPNRDANQICDEILQVFHHPALRDGGKQGQRAMYEAVENWWNEKDNDSKEHLKQALSRDGVREGKNHEGEDPNPGPGGCGHSHGGMKASGGSSQQNQGRRDQQESSSGGNNSGGGGGGYNAPSRSHQEESSYGGGGDGGYNAPSRSRQEESSYGSGGNRQEESSYGGNSGGYNAPSRSRQEESSYGSGGNRQEESTYGGNSGGGGGYNESSRNRQEESSYGSGGDRQEESTYGSGGGGGSYNSPSRSRQDENSYNSGGGGSYNSPSRSRQEDSSHGSRQEESSYGSGGGNRQESSYGASDSYGSSNRQQTSSYGDGSGSRNNDNQTSYGRDTNEDVSGSSARHWGGEETTSSYNASRETSSYSRKEEQTESYSSNNTSSYGQETSSYGRDNQDSSNYGRNTSSYGDNQESGSQGRRRGEDQEEEGSGGYGGGGGGGYSNY